MASVALVLACCGVLGPPAGFALGVWADRLRQRGDPAPGRRLLARLGAASGPFAAAIALVLGSRARLSSPEGSLPHELAGWALALALVAVLVVPAVAAAALARVRARLRAA